MEEIKKIPERSEIAKEDTWAIEDLYESDEAWEAVCLPAKDGGS